MNEPLLRTYLKKKFSIEKALVAFFANSSTGYFSGKLFFERHPSGQTGSNDTALEFVSCLRAEKKGGHTDRQILSIIYRDLMCNKLIRNSSFS